MLNTLPIISGNEENEINELSQIKLQVFGGWEKWFGGEGL